MTFVSRRFAALIAICGAVSCDTPTKPATVPPASGSVEVYATSAGFRKGGLTGDGMASLGRKPGWSYSKGGGAGGGRGFNIALVDRTSGELKSSVEVFDTWRSPGPIPRLLSVLEQAPDGTLILLAVADEAGLTRWDSCGIFGGDAMKLVGYLKSLGSTMIEDYCYQNSWSMITIKGEGKKDEQLSRDKQVTSRYILQQ